MSDEEFEELDFHPVDYVCPSCGEVSNWFDIVDTYTCIHCGNNYTTDWEALLNGE